MIFPYYQSDRQFKTVLFVGCNTYTTHYQRQYFQNVNFWTIEPDAALSKFGSDRHVVAPLEEVGRHFAEGFFDLIICNGVFGWGLDRATQCEAAFSQCYTCLRDGGQMVLGWDDVPRRTPVALAEIASLARFQKMTFPPLGTWRYLTDTPYRHTYDFYQKPATAP
jgi:SAM-dependent methyltransferase